MDINCSEIIKCLKCKKEFPPHSRKYRFCKECRIDFGNETYLDNCAFIKINEQRDRKALPVDRLFGIEKGEWI